MTGNGKGNLKSDDMDFLELAKKRFPQGLTDRTR